MIAPLFTLTTSSSSTGRSTNYPPVAIISEPPHDVFLRPGQPRVVVFDASGSYDPNGALAGWRWDFGDGTSVEGMRVEHEFPGPGLYTVILTVYDHAGLEDRAVRRVGIYMGQNPVAVIARPASGTVVCVNWTVLFSSEGSYDPLSSELNFLWAFGDGRSSTDPAPVHRYARPGAYAITLRVTNANGLWSEATTSLVVQAPPEPRTEWRGSLSLEGSRVYSRHSILLSGELRVRGSLVLVGSELIVDPGDGDSGRIIVESGGRLALLSGTFVHSTDPLCRFQFVVEEGGELLVENSELRDCGRLPAQASGMEGDYSSMGLYIASSHVCILNSTIARCGVGAFVDEGASPKISGNTIMETDGPSLAVFGSSSPAIHGNRIIAGRPGPLLPNLSPFAGAAAILSINSSPVITDNLITCVNPDPYSPVSGIELRGDGTPFVARNRIVSFSGESGCQGILAVGSQARIHANELVANTVGIRVQSGKVETRGNTVNGTALPTHACLSSGIWDSSASSFVGDRVSGYDVGVVLDAGSISTMENLIISDCIIGVTGRPVKPAFAVTMASCTFSRNIADVILGGEGGPECGGNLCLVEPAYTSSRVRVDSPRLSLSVTWLLQVRAIYLHSGEPVSGARVSLTDARSELTYELWTGPDGRTRAIALPEYTLSGGVKSARSSYKISVMAEGGTSTELISELNESRELTVGLGEFGPELSIVVEPASWVEAAGLGYPRPEGNDNADFVAPWHPESGANQTRGVGTLVLRASCAEALKELPINYTWELGDGTTANGPSVSHIYEKPGKYTVVLRASYGLQVRTVVYELRVKGGEEAVVVENPFGAHVAIALALALLVAAACFIGGTEIGLYSVSALLMLLYSKLQSSRVLDNFIRGKIYGYIIANPGDHYNSIMSALKLSNGTFAYHLRVLERQGLIKSQVDGVYKRFYPADMVVLTPDKRELTRIQKIIFHLVVDRPGISQKEVAGILNVSSATVNYHMEALMKKELVKRVRSGMRVRYYPLVLELEGKEADTASFTAPPP